MSLVLCAGDQVTADASVLESSGFEADESLLSGGSNPVGKDHGTDVLSSSGCFHGPSGPSCRSQFLWSIGDLQVTGGWRHMIITGTWTAALVGDIANVLAAVPRRVDVPCRDKTGILTQGGLKFEAVRQLRPAPDRGWQQARG